MSFYQGITYVAIGDPVAGVFVEIQDLDARDFYFKKTPFGVGDVSAFDEPIEPGDRSELRFSFLATDGSVVDQLRQWMDADSRVYLFAFGPSVAITWNEPTRVRIERSETTGFVRGRSDVFNVQMTRVGHGRHDIHAGTSILAYNAWRDGPTTDVPFGYTFYDGGGASVTIDFSGTPRVFTVTADAIAYLYHDIFCPVQAVSISWRFSVHVIQLHTSSSNYKFQVDWLDKTKASLATQSKTVTATGRDNREITNGPAGTMWLRVTPLIMPTATSGTVKVRDPALRIDAGTDYLLF